MEKKEGEGAKSSEGGAVSAERENVGRGMGGGVNWREEGRRRRRRERERRMLLV